MGSKGSRTVIETSDLRKEYGSTTAVDDLSLTVFENEIFGLLGPNGAGKTTLVEILQGLRTPTSGTATVLGLDLQESLYEIKDRIGVVPQSFQTFERLTVKENVALMADLHSDSLAVADVLEELDLAEWANVPFESLSGGYQRRTGIAMALVSDPEILFLDEPTTGLDPAARRSTWEQIERLPEMGTTVVLTSHYMDEVEYLADRVALLVDGQIEAVDTVAELIDTFAGAVKLVVHLTDQTPETEEKSLATLLEESAASVYRNDDGALIGVFSDRQTAQDVYTALHDLGTGHSIDLISPGMEDVFLELAGQSLTPEGDLE